VSRATYEIRAVGNVPRELLEDFSGVRVATDPAGTTIRADLADEAELHGLLDALRREGFALVEVHREPAFDFSDTSLPREGGPEDRSENPGVVRSDP
jgi:hypothetical protein